MTLRLINNLLFLNLKKILKIKQMEIMTNKEEEEI